MSKTIEDLREHLFATIQGVRDGSVSVEQAKTVSELSQVIVNTAKVEVDFVRATERRDSRFLGIVDAQPAAALPGRRLENGIAGIRRHVLGDE
jgi:hypothetical protein